MVEDQRGQSVSEKDLGLGGIVSTGGLPIGCGDKDCGNGVLPAVTTGI